MAKNNDTFGIEPVSRQYNYPHIEKQTRRKLVTETYEYEFPFKYENIEVNRYVMRSREAHGIELAPANYHVVESGDGCSDAHDYQGDHLVVTDQQAIVRIVVIGSACTPPGWVQIECEPIAEWRNRYEVHGVLPVRFRQDNLWGMHLRVDVLNTHTPDVRRKFENFSNVDEGYESMPEANRELYRSTIDNPLYCKSDYHENPLAGMSSASFEIPPSKKVIIQAGSQIPGWCSDNFPGDAHYSIRTIRTDVLCGNAN